MEKIILYYKFHPIADPLIFCHWQKALCQQLGLKGRIIVSPQGLNGTLGGSLKALKAYKKAQKAIPYLRDMEYKWSNGGSADFPKLSVKVRPEPVTLAARSTFSAQVATPGLSPRQWHQYLRDHPNTLVLDARNYYESDIGYFEAPNLIKPKISSFKEIKPLVDTLPKDQPILTYCTGDIRCEYLSAYMHSRGFATVHHLKGGIMKYGQMYGDRGFWRGRCYVFDKRQKIAFSGEALDVAHCLQCRQPTSEQVNCDDCNRQIVLCLVCQRAPYRHCQNLTISSQQR